jgi:hypothetical protein
MTDTNPPADRTAEIRARLDAATEGPWIYESAADIHGVEDDRIHYVTPQFAARDDDPPMTSFYDRADAELVANAPTDIAYLLGRVEELEGQLAKVGRIIEPRDADWKPLSERYPQYFKAVSDEERARRNGWDQGVSLMSQRIKAVLGGTEPTTAPDSEMDPFEAADDIDRRCGS